MEFEKNLLDLCRINLMEEHVAESSAVDKNATMKAIGWKKQNLMERLKCSLSEIIEEASTSTNKRVMPLSYPCSECGSNGDCVFVGSTSCPLR
jgi:hypothetical protein